MYLAFSPPVVVFIYSLFFGIGLAIVWDFFRIIRKHIKSIGKKVFVLDILYFLISIVVTLVFFFLFTSSGFRSFVIVGEILGAVLYYVTAEPYVFKVLIAVDFFFTKKLKIFYFIKRFFQFFSKFSNKISSEIRNVKLKKELFKRWCVKK